MSGRFVASGCTSQNPHVSSTRQGEDGAQRENCKMEGLQMARLMKRWAAIFAVIAAFVVCSGHMAAFAVGNSTHSSDDLHNHITSVDIQGAETEGDAIKVRPGTELTFKLSFAERPDMQFDNEKLIYKLPDGFDYGTQEGTFPLSIGHDGQTYRMNVPYTIKDGTLTITWPKDDEGYQYFIEGSNGRFNISFNATYENARGNIDFGNGVTEKFELDDSHGVDVKKDGYVGDDGKIHYTVKVTSTGRNENVQVKDAISGTALTLDKDSLQISGNSSDPTYGSADNGFDLTLPSMNAGEVATITYTASIDYSKISGKGTKGQTENDVVVDTPDDPKVPDQKDSKDFENQIDEPGLSKSGQASGDAVTKNGKTYRQVTWTIDANDKKHASLAGRTISDHIADGSKDAMKYSGNGVQIQVYDASGNLVDTRTPSWSELGADPDTAASWTYHVPATDKNYEYKITYTTDVDMTNAIAAKQVENDTAISEGPSTSGKVDVPSDFNFNVTKKLVGTTEQAAQWQFDITVPAEGYDSLEAVDTLPKTYLDGDRIDKLDPQSVQVSGLAGDESYKTDVQNDKVTFTFYQDKDKEHKGLTGTGKERIVTVTLSTTYDKTWLDACENGTAAAYQLTHTNTVDATANGVKKTSTAEVQPALKQTIEKRGSANGMTYDGANRPVYRYELILTGVNGDIDIDDAFDTDVLSHYVSNQWDADAVFGGDQYSQSQRVDNKKAEMQATGTGLHIHVPKDNLAKDGSGNYYSHYRIVYYLAVKDANALKTLDQRAADRPDDDVTLQNTATWNGKSAEKSVDYSYQFLTKTLTKTPDAEKDDRTASYTLQLNPDGMDINPDGDTVALTDEMTNQELDVSSVKAVPSDGVSYDYDAKQHVLRVTIPDKTHVTLTYNTTVTGAGDVTYSNTATLHGQSRGTKNTAQLSHGGAGSISIPYVKLLKHADGNENQVLSGARFALYKAGAAGATAHGDPVLDEDDKPVSFTSDDKGIVMVQGRENTDGWTLQEDTPYYLVETKAPDGYRLDPTPIPFTITSDPKTAGEYVNGFTIGVANSPNDTSGYALPQTGGFGTGPLTAAALVLAIGGAGGLVYRRLRNAGL